MGKIDLLLRKEEINDGAMKNQIAVVFDILLATSTISSMFYHGAKEIMPVLDGKEALKKAEEQTEDDDYILVGEYLGRTIEGFLDPIPTSLKQRVKGKRVIFSTTNGTVALKNSWAADAVYAASMLNEKMLAEHLINHYGNRSYMMVCSGSSEQFNLEDLYGAGSFIENLLEQGKKRGISLEMSDAALTALHFYKGNREQGESLLKVCRVGNNLVNKGYPDEIAYILKKNACPVLPRMEGEVLRLVDAMSMTK